MSTPAPQAPPTVAGRRRLGLGLWGRSLQVRVIVSTLVLSALVVGVVGWVLLQQTRDGLLDGRVRAVVAEAGTETTEAETRLEGVPGTQFDPTRQKSELVQPIIDRGASRGFGVVMTGPAGAGNAGIEQGGNTYSTDLDPASVPVDLERHLADSADPAWTYAAIRYTDGRPSVPGVVVGANIVLPADGQTYRIYYLFPLTREQQTLGLVTRALLTAGVLLLFLLAAVTWLVTRQVVTPVRLVRQVAERLAAGRLQERLPVSGSDDIARLATSFNQMAASLQQQISQLEELSRVQRRFVSDVSHELRTPLTTVRMAGDILHDARGDFDPVTARSAELLQTELDRFETLLADLLEISRFDAGAAVLDVDDVNLVDVAHRVVDATRRLAEGRGVRVVVRSPTRPCLAEGDVRRLERIVRNLVTNAIDHAESGEVVVLVAGDAHAAALAVRDYGVGLAPEQASMVFERFWRADPARDRSTGGTGLGLAIALEDTHLHGGWLQAWGRPGQGAQFRLTLPRRVGGDLRSSPLPLVPLDAGVDAGRRTPPTTPPTTPSTARRSADGSARSAGPAAAIGTAVSHRRDRSRLALVATVLLVLPVVAGCVVVPTSGAVRDARSSASASPPPEATFVPRGPTRGQSPEETLDGFFAAMLASPMSASVARRFLTEQDAGRWAPEDGYLTYGSRQVSGQAPELRVRLDGVNRFDARGAWTGSPPGGRLRLRVQVQQTPDGPRLAGVPDALMVSDDWFEQQTDALSVYYLDPAGRSLVAEPVFVPRGAQRATLLVHALLDGPVDPRVERTFVPVGTRLNLSVTLRADGTAEVPLADDLGQLPESSLDRLAAQFAATLRQIPEVTRIRLLVRGRPLPVVGDQTTFDVTTGSVYDLGGLYPVGRLFGLRDGRAVRLADGRAADLDGTLRPARLPPARPGPRHQRRAGGRRERRGHPAAARAGRRLE